MRVPVALPQLSVMLRSFFWDGFWRPSVPVIIEEALRSTPFGPCVPHSSFWITSRILLVVVCKSLGSADQTTLEHTSANVLKQVPVNRFSTAILAGLSSSFARYL